MNVSPASPSPAAPAPPRRRWLALLTNEWLILALIMGVAFFFRFYQLTMIPAEFEFDEWAESADALDMLQNGLRVFSTLNYGRELLFSYLVMIGFKLVGPQDIVLRFIAATAGTLTVGASYFLVKEMFSRVAATQARWLATLTSLGLAVSFWQVIHIRMGRRHTLLPLLLSVGFYFLWRGFHSGRRWPFALAGLFLGGCLYTYPSARFIPIALVTFFLLDALTRRFSRAAGPALWRQHGQNLLLLAAVAAVVVAPLAYYFIFSNPDQFFFRVNQISIVSGQESTAVAPSLWQTISGNFLGLFWHGDEDSLYNIPGRPMFGPVMAIALAVGLALALWRWRQSPYLFTVVWWLVMMSPAFLVNDRIPAFKRSIGIVPAVFIFPALAWTALAGWLTRRWPGKMAWTVAIVAPLLVYSATAAITYRDYFLVWGPAHPHFQDVLMYRDVGAKMLADNNPNQLWLFPQDVRNIVRRYYRLNGITSFSGLPPRAFITVDEQAMFAELQQAVQGFERVVLVNVSSGQEALADPKGILPFLLEKYGQFETLYASPDHPYRLDTYRLDSPAAQMQPAQQWQPVGINFGSYLQVAQVAVGDASGSQPPDTRQVPSGETAWVTLRWRTLNPSPADYMASVRLTAPDGHVVAQADRTLMNVQQRPTIYWQPGDEVLDYYLLPLEPGTPPGNYTVEVLLYQPDTGAILSPDQPSTVTPGAAPVAALPVTPALNPAQPVAPAQPLNQPWGNGLTLLGRGELPAQVQPGDRFELALAWQQSGDSLPAAATQVDLALMGPAEVSLARNLRVGGDAFPTTAWRASETVLQWETVQVPATVAPGNYQLTLTDAAADNAVVLGDITITEGRLRQFEPPPGLQHPLSAMFGNRVALLGFDAVQTDALELTLFWQAQAQLPDNYKVFVHVLNEQGELITQQDQIPMAGQAPTSGWLPGEVIADSYRFELPPGALSPGQYRLAVGLYNAISGERLPLSGQPADELILPYTIEIGG